MKKIIFITAFLSSIIFLFFVSPQSVSAQVCGFDFVVGNGTPNFIPIWTSAGSFLGTSTIYQNSFGNIGIGIVNPQSKLHVAGKIIATGDICTDLNGGICLSRLMTPNQGTTQGTTLSTQGSPSYSPPNTSPGEGGGYWALRDIHIYNLNPGNVGIATLNPQYTLDVNGSLRANSLTAGLNVETLTAEKTLISGKDKMYQWLDPSGANRVRLSTLNAKPGDRFVIKNNADVDSIISLQIYQDKVLLDRLSAQAIREYIFDGTNWVAGNSITGVFSDSNISIGHQALASNRGLAIGFQASAFNYGTAVGRLTDASNYGVALGNYADGSRYGVGVGSYSSGINYGIALGYYAQGNNRGVSVGSFAKSSYYGVAVGYASGYNFDTFATQNSNTLIGAYSGYQLTTGVGNIMIGYGSGYDGIYSPTTGSYNILIGYNAWTPSSDTSNFLNIGGLIFGTNLSTNYNTLSTGNVGIGVKNPQTKLHVAGKIRATDDICTDLGGGKCLSKISSQENYWFLSGSNFYPVNNSWNVGIGTNKPLAKLHISVLSTTTVPFRVDALTSSFLSYFVRQIIIDNSSNPDSLSNFQILVNLDTQSLIRAGKMNSDCGDIRFFDSDNTSLNYWLESGCNTASTKIWVKVPSIPAESKKTIYLTYGNAGLTSQSKIWDNISHLNIYGGVFDYNINFLNRLTGKIISLAAGAYHTCALLKNGNVKCWGNDIYDLTKSYTGADAVAITAGAYHTCALLKNGNVKCWGWNSYGQANDYTGGDAIGVSAGQLHTCALLKNGNVKCWGWNSYGQANDYTGGDAIGLSSGFYHTCALLRSGDVKCWRIDQTPTGGASDFGQANDYLGGDAIAVTTGESHTCALLKNGNVKCWGWNFYGQSNDYLGGDAIGVSAGAYHTCALLKNGNVKCWGRDGQANDYSGGDAIGVTAGQFHTCALLAKGNVSCWGDNSYYQSNNYSDGNVFNPFRKYASLSPAVSLGSETSGTTQKLASVFIINNNGNIGIGTTNPKSKLDVVGTVNASAFTTGDIIFQKDDQKLWRLFEAGDGLYLENIQSGKKYRLLMEEINQ